MLANYEIDTRFSGVINNARFVDKNLYLIADDKVPVSIVGYKVFGNACRISFVANELSESKQRKFMLYLIEDITRKTHPERIIIDYASGISLAALQYVGIKRVNNNFVKYVDEYRLSLDDSIFDKEGYIIYQGKMKSVKFGLISSNINGCGWISAYNLSKMLGKEIPMKECANGLAKTSISGKLFGQEVFTLFYWLKKKGLPVKFSFLSKGNGIKHMKESKCGILLYTHKRGSHYTAYRNVGNGKVQFYNAVYGKQNHIMKVEDFFKKYVLLPIAMVIYVE